MSVIFEDEVELKMIAVRELLDVANKQRDSK